MHACKRTAWCMHSEILHVARACKIMHTCMQLLASYIYYTYLYAAYEFPFIYAVAVYSYVAIRIATMPRDQFKTDVDASMQMIIYARSYSSLLRSKLAIVVALKICYS